MSGIIGYVGHREAEDVLVQGLCRLGRHGYDSAGVVTLTDSGRVYLRKRAGLILKLTACLKERPAPGRLGIAHLRWATHGPVTDANAHPHLGFDGKVAVVHNGFIENHAALKRQVRDDGIRFCGDTDSEVIAHLLACHLNGDLLEALRRVLPLLRGTYALAAVSPSDRRRIVAASLGSPLVLGVAEGECFLASDPVALAGQADELVQLDDNQICELTASGWRVYGRRRTQASVSPPAWDTGEADRGGYEHYMLKEIMEQPLSLENTLRGRLDDAAATARLDGLTLAPEQWRQVGRLILTASGTSYHAAQAGRHFLEQFAQIAVEVVHTSEFLQQDADREAVAVALAGSGESPNTLRVLRAARRRGQRVLALSNLVGGRIAEEADGCLYLRAGPELALTGTKSFTAQVLVLALLSLHLGRMRHLTPVEGARLIADLRTVPELARQTLRCDRVVQRVAARYHRRRDFLCGGRGTLFPVALDGASKLRELCRFRAEAVYTGLTPDALTQASKGAAFIILALRGPEYENTLRELQQIKANGGTVVAVAEEADHEVAKFTDQIISVPPSPWFLQPVLAALPFQLLAYHAARLRGYELDKAPDPVERVADE